MTSDLDRIQHILDCIARIKRLASGMDRDSFRSDPALADAVAYNIMIIGEATRCSSDAFKETHPDVPWKQIRAMRNILVHDYVRTDVDQLWLVVENDLDDLAAKMTAAKSAQPSPPPSPAH